MDPSEMLAGELARNAQNLAALQALHAGIVAASEASNGDDEHDPEGATIAYEREQVTALLARAQRVREALHGALERVDAGTYGACEACGAPIPPGRLEARPDARLCIACAS